MTSPPWESSATIASSPLPEQADVVVIGCGLAGATAALELARAGASVAIVEAEDAVGRGASGRRPGLACAGHPEHPGRLVHALGLADATALHQHGRSGLDYLEAEGLLERSGALWAALGHQEIREMPDSQRALAAMGSEATPLSETEVGSRLGGEGFGPGMWIPEDGLLEPTQATSQLTQRAVQAGAVLCTGCTVTGVSHRADGITLHVAGGRAVRCEVVLFASEARSPEIDPFFVEKVVPLREQALAVRAPVGRVPSPGRAQYGYFRWRQSADILTIGGCRWATPHMEVGETHASPEPRVQARLQAGLAARFPDLASAEVIARWAWIEATTCDRLPLVGPLPGSPTVVCCVGFQGHAPSLGVAAGLGVARGLLTGDHGVPARLAPARFL